MTIADWRMQIDDVDNELLRLLNQRAKLAAMIGRLKQEANLPLNDERREHSLLARLRAVNVGPLDDTAVTLIFQQIISETRRVEARVPLSHLTQKSSALARPKRRSRIHPRQKGEELS